MEFRKAVFGAFGRSSSALSLVILVAFAAIFLSTAYHLLVLSPDEFRRKPEVQEYENAVENVGKMDEWARTQYYWSNNLGVAGIYALGTPSYLGFNSVAANSYRMGMSLTYNYYRYGPEGMLGFFAAIFTHGLLELTGVYLIAAVSLRISWNLWKGLGALAEVKGRGKHRMLGLTGTEKREILRHKRTIKLLLSDFVVLFAIGTFLVFLAAPIEAYISPSAWYEFTQEPKAAAAFLVGAVLVYALIAAFGFNQMRKDMVCVLDNLRTAFKGEWRPEHLPILVFLISLALTLARLMW